MTDLTHDHVSSNRLIGLKILAALYTIAIPVAHLSFPTTSIWLIAIIFSIAMNFTYPWAAYKQGRFMTLEVALSSGFIALSLVSLYASPIFVITAIFLHGCWDLAKHRGAGTPFFFWYISGCVVVDWIYAAALLIAFFF